MSTNFPIDKFKFKSDSILHGLPQTELDFLLNKMTIYTLRKGQTLFVEGTNPNGIYYLKKGKVKKFKSSRDGKEQIIYICNNGEFLGYSALLSEESYPDSAAAIEDSIIGFINKDDFLHILDISSILSKKLLVNLSHEFGVLVNGIASFAHRSVRERVALSLLILKDRYRNSEEPDAPIEIVLSREDLSNLVGVAVETLVRILHDFKDEKIIETAGRKIRIINVKKLIQIANFF